MQIDLKLVAEDEIQVNCNQTRYHDQPLEITISTSGQNVTANCNDNFNILQFDKGTLKCNQPYIFEVHLIEACSLTMFKEGFLCEGIYKN